MCQRAWRREREGERGPGEWPSQFVIMGAVAPAEQESQVTSCPNDNLTSVQEDNHLLPDDNLNTSPRRRWTQTYILPNGKPKSPQEEGSPPARQQSYITSKTRVTFSPPANSSHLKKINIEGSPLARQQSYVTSKTTNSSCLTANSSHLKGNGDRCMSCPPAN